MITEINNIESLSCGNNGCRSADITINNPQNGFSIECSGLLCIQIYQIHCFQINLIFCPYNTFALLFSAICVYVTNQTYKKLK